MSQLDAVDALKMYMHNAKTMAGKGKFSSNIWLNVIPDTVLTTTVIDVLAQSECNERLLSYRTLKCRMGSR